MTSKPLKVLLADDDIDDCTFFKNALADLPIATSLAIVHDGEQLMRHLTQHTQNLPDLIFLDLSMPRKTGFECLSEIKQHDDWKDIAVFVFSTSFTRDLNYERNLIGALSLIGAEEYIRKPGDFEQLKQIIHNTLIKVSTEKALKQPGAVADTSVAQHPHLKIGY